MSLRDLLPAIVQPFSKVINKVQPGARILMYHRISDLPHYDQLTVGVKQFDLQMQWLSKHKNVKSLQAILDDLASGQVNSNDVAITFDDGYLDNLEFALPILEKYQLPAMIYISCDFASQEVSHPRYKKQSKRLHLNWEEINALSRHPLISIGSHTLSHPMLSEISDDQSFDEINKSKLMIEQNIQSKAQHFCYPSGNYTAREIYNIQSSGYASAVTVKPGKNTLKADLLTLRRTEVTDKDTPKILQQKLDGAFDVFHLLLDIKREIGFSRKRKQ